MIRHETDDEYVLITQHEHAQLSGVLAGHFGNGRFSPPAPYDPAILGIRLHDCGWPLHDECPTLKAGKPLDVFETTPQIAGKVWTASVERACEADAYAGLLVSLHVLALSTLVEPHKLTQHERFALNRFQHGQIERQEQLRTRLGLRTDLPLQLGLAEPGIDPQEDQLRFNFRLLQAMDRVSLALCGAAMPFDGIDKLPPAPDKPPTSISFARDEQGAWVLDPWPFEPPHLSFNIPCKRLKKRAFSNEMEFQQEYAAAPAGLWTAELISRQG